MAVLRECLRRVWGALRRNPADHDLERELRFHLEEAEEELRGRGYSPAEAARLARVRLGGFPGRWRRCATSAAGRGSTTCGPMYGSDCACSGGIRS